MKLLVICTLSLSALFAQDKPPAQPPLEERFKLMQEHRDYLVKQIARRDAEAVEQATSNILQTHAKEVSDKFNCETWNPDFTCVVKAAPKVEEKPKTTSKLWPFHKG